MVGKQIGTGDERSQQSGGSQRKAGVGFLKIGWSVFVGVEDLVAVGIEYLEGRNVVANVLRTVRAGVADRVRAVLVALRSG
jgi:hypothetical protein